MKISIIIFFLLLSVSFAEECIPPVSLTLSEPLTQLDCKRLEKFFRNENLFRNNFNKICKTQVEKLSELNKTDLKSAGKEFSDKLVKFIELFYIGEEVSLQFKTVKSADMVDKDRRVALIIFLSSNTLKNEFYYGGGDSEITFKNYLSEGHINKVEVYSELFVKTALKLQSSDGRLSFMEYLEKQKKLEDFLKESLNFSLLSALNVQNYFNQPEKFPEALKIIILKLGIK